MQKIPLDNACGKRPLLLIFAEGTILKPRSWLSLFTHCAYVPIGNAVEKIRVWRLQGAEIVYCTSRRGRQAAEIAALLRCYGFEGAFLAARERGEAYRNIVEALRPDILVEDDCKSIGGAWQMCITKELPELRCSIVSIAVPEFRGIDHLPDEISQLRNRLI